MKILVVDDLVTNVSVLRVSLSRLGHTVFTARDGAEAIAVLKSEPVDVVLTDWMMPNLDGLGLIRWIRTSLDASLLVIVITALRLNEAEAQALDAGADAFLVKPVSPAQIGTIIGNLHEKKSTTGVQKHAPSTVAQRVLAPAFDGIAFGAGTGGAQGVRTIFSSMKPFPSAAFFIVIHGPGWAAEALAEQMQSEIKAPVIIPKENEPIKSGTVYVAPGDRHMTIAPNGLTIALTQTPPENFHRPSIDPLFRSLAEVFGRRSTGVVLAGTGIDGYIGAGHIQVAHGMIIVQEPSETASSQMTKNVITLGLANRVLPLEKIGGELIETLRRSHDGRHAIVHPHNNGLEK